MTTETTNTSVIAPQLQDKLTEVIGNIQTQVSNAATFAWDQMSDIAVSYVHFGMAYNTTVLLLWAIVAAVATKITLKYGYFSTASGPYGGWADSKISAVVFGTIASGGSILGAFLSVKPFLLVWFAPKVWLLQELADMVRNVKG